MIACGRWLNLWYVLPSFGVVAAIMGVAFKEHLELVRLRGPSLRMSTISRDGIVGGFPTTVSCTGVALSSGSW